VKIRNVAWRWIAVLAAAMTPAPLRAGTAVVIQPISASGQHAIIGTDIFLPSGPQRVRFEVRIAGWGVRELRTVQVQLDTSGFAGGAPPLDRTKIPCPSNNSTGHSFCGLQLETGSRCQTGCPPGSTSGCFCDWIFQNTGRSDYAGFGLLHISAVDLTQLDPRLGFTLQPFDYVEDLGASFYLGTFFVEVPAEAQGIYTIGIIHTVVESPTFMHDYSLSDPIIPIELHAAARVIIGPPESPASRTILYRPAASGTQTAVRVRVNSLYHPGPPVAAGEDRDFGNAEGAVYWLGPPAYYPNSIPGSSFSAAFLQCTPYFADWDSVGAVHIYGDAIVPSSEYRFNEVSIDCEEPTDPACFGPPQTLHTGQWGDVVEPFARSDRPAQPDALDIAELMDVYRGLADALLRPKAQLWGTPPDPARDINFIDIQLAVDAYRSTAYPFAVPAICP